jgi:hypothetical protein
MACGWGLELLLFSVFSPNSKSLNLSKLSTNS